MEPWGCQPGPSYLYRLQPKLRHVFLELLAWLQVTFLPLEWCGPACVSVVRSCILFNFTGCEGGKGEFMAGLDRENKP